MNNTNRSILVSCKFFVRFCFGLLFVLERLKTLWLFWCPHTDSNREPIDYKSIALPIELWGQKEFIKIFKVSNLNTALKFLKGKEFWVSAFDVSATKDFTKNNWKGKNVLLFGSEGYGIKAKTLENSDFKFRVNMNNNIESLNISNTVSVVCHHIFNCIK